MVQELNAANRRRRPHYIAALFYLFVAVLGVAALVSGQFVGIVVTLIAAPYSVYLFRGGRVVVWIW